MNEIAPMSVSDRLDEIDSVAPYLDDDDMESEVLAATAALRAVLDRHEGYPNSVNALYPDPACNECGQTMPCPTVRAIATALGEEV